MKKFCFIGLVLAVVFSACEPKFNLNAPYKDVTVVYGLLNYKDTIHYVKIYKGFQSTGSNQIFVDAQNPNNLYYYDKITATLAEYKNNSRTSRPQITLGITHEVPKDSGIFAHPDQIVYYTKESIDPTCEYVINIVNKESGRIVTGKTGIVNNFGVNTLMTTVNMNAKNQTITFTIPNTYPAADRDSMDYEIFVDFLYFEVDNVTHQVTYEGTVSRNLSPRVGSTFGHPEPGKLDKNYTPTFYTDIANQLKPKGGISRYIGRPGNGGVCIQFRIWAGGKNYVKYLKSNYPTSNFVQVSTYFTNMQAADKLAFGFFSSRTTDSPRRSFPITAASQDTLIKSSKTSHLGFKPWVAFENPKK